MIVTLLQINTVWDTTTPLSLVQNSPSPQSPCCMFLACPQLEIEHYIDGHGIDIMSTMSVPVFEGGGNEKGRNCF